MKKKTAIDNFFVFAELIFVTKMVIDEQRNAWNKDVKLDKLNAKISKKKVIKGTIDIYVI